MRDDENPYENPSIDEVLPLCACGCGYRVHSLDMKFRPNHRCNPAGQYVYVRPNHPRYGMGGRIRTDGSRPITVPRFIMANHLGRDLRPDERVLRLNGDKRDNRLVNLKLFENSSELGRYRSLLKEPQCESS
jgi:hypothetical protein